LATVFNTILFLIVAAFFVPEFFCFVPIFILGFIYFTEFKIRLLLVMLSSVLMPVLSAWGICFLCNNTALFNEFFKNLFVLSFKINIQFFGINFALFSVVFISFLVVSLFFFIKNIRNYKFRVRRFIFFLLLLWATTICLIMFYENKFNCFVAPCMILGSFFITLNFTNLHSKSNAIIFLIFLTVFSMIYAVQFI
jgi:hypothetical protein